MSFRTKFSCVFIPSLTYLPSAAWHKFANVFIVSAVLVLSFLSNKTDDLPLWRELTSANTLDNNTEATRSYYIKKYKQHKELTKRRLEEEKRQLYLFPTFPLLTFLFSALERQLQQEEQCATAMTWLAFNRVYEWLIFFGLIFTTITTVLKLDNHIDWNWAIILSPFFFTALQFLYAPLMYDASSVYFQKNFEDSIADENKYCGPILYLIMFMMPLGNTSDSKRRLIVYVNTGISKKKSNG